MKRRNSDDYIRELVRKLAAGEFEDLPRLSRALERMGEGRPGFDLRSETRRLVDESRRREGSNLDGAIRDVLTELVHLANENGIDIQGSLDAAISVTMEEREGPYAIGELSFEGMECDERRSYGQIVIGGDRGDVHAVEARNYDAPTGFGVELSGVVLRTSLTGLSDEEAEEIARDIVQESWHSVGKDMFISST